MKIFRIAMALFLLSTAVTAMAEPASDTSIKQLLAVSQAKEFSDDLKNQIDSIMNNVVNEALNGKKPTPKQQKAIHNMMAKTSDLFKKEMAWDKLEPMYIRLYRETFTEEEVNGMLAFYKTPAGKAVIEKMPALMQKSAVESQKIISSSMPKMKKIRDDFQKEINAAGN